MSRKQAGSGGGIVYSTEHGQMCPACRQAAADCACHHSSPPAATDGVVRVGRETKGRKGKGVTLVTGVPLPDDELTALCTRLKKKCGSGGTVKESVIEIQGDHRDLVMEELARLGWTVKRSGG